MSDFDKQAFMRESIAHSLRKHESILSSQARPEEKETIGSVNADKYYAHAIQVSLLDDWIILDFYDTDRDEPLRPQTFAVTPAEWNSLKGSGDKLGRLRKLSGGNGSLETEDAYGSHFSVSWTPELEAIDAVISKRFSNWSPPPRAEELHTVLDRLESGAWSRFHPVVTAVQDRFEEDPESIALLKKQLNADVSPSLKLFCCGLLHQSLKEKEPALLVNTLLEVAEQTTGSEREAAEGHLSHFPSIGPEAVKRLAGLLAGRGDQPYDVGSVLRPLRAQGEQAAVAVPALVKILPSLADRAKASHRLESQSVVHLALEILEQVPGSWKEARPAVEYLIRGGWKRAEETKETMLKEMPIPWERGLVLPKVTARPKPADKPAAHHSPIRSPGPEPDEKGRLAKFKEVAKVLIALAFGIYIYSSLTSMGGDRAPEPRAKKPPQPRQGNKPQSQPPSLGDKAPPSSQPALTIGGAELTKINAKSGWKLEGEVVEKGESWQRLRTPQGQVVTLHRRKNDPLPQIVASDYLWDGSKVVAKSGDAYQTVKPLVKNAAPKIELQVDKDKTVYGFYASTTSRGTSILAPHPTAAQGSAPFLASLSQGPEAVKKAMSDYPGWKTLRLIDGEPILHHLLRKLSTDKRLSKKEQAQVDVAKLLINGGYDLNLVDTAWNTPLHVARDRETTELLLKKKQSFLNTPNLSGRTPLFGAGTVKTSLLLKAGADPNTKDKRGLTPIMLSKDADAVLALLREGADANAVDAQGRNALFYQSDLTTLVLLMSQGADPDLKDKEGKTPLDVRQGSSQKSFQLARRKANR